MILKMLSQLSANLCDTVPLSMTPTAFSPTALLGHPGGSKKYFGTAINMGSPLKA